MTFASASQFHILLCVNDRLVCLNSVLNVEALVDTFNQEKGKRPNGSFLHDCEIFAKERSGKYSPLSADGDSLLLCL